MWGKCSEGGILLLVEWLGREVLDVIESLREVDGLSVDSRDRSKMVGKLNERGVREM